MNNYNEIKVISQYKSICLIGHINPDADALASMKVLKDFLCDYFKIENISLFADCEKIPTNCNEIIDNDTINQPTKKEFDVAIMIDSPNTQRLGKYKNLFEKAKCKIVIDHHQTNLFDGDVNIVEEQSSTCEIVYSIIKFFKYVLNKKNKSNIYAGIITDTNNFTVGNFNQITFKIMSEIIDDIDHEHIYNNFFSNNSLKNMQILAKSINNIKTYYDNKILISHISLKEAEDFNITNDDYLGIINRLSTITNSLLICFIYPKDKQYYVSMRAKQNLKVSQLAKENGGGGHDGAAAFLSDKTIEEIECEILEEFTKILNQI